MKYVSPSEERELQEFATSAATWFRANPEGRSYSADNPTQNQLLALRWNLDHVCVLRVGWEEPRLYPVADLIGVDDATPARLQITSLSDLAAAAKARKSVTANHPSLSRPRAAAFVINYSGAVLLGLINAGLFIHEPLSK